MRFFCYNYSNSLWFTQKITQVKHAIYRHSNSCPPFYQGVLDMNLKFGNSNLRISEMYGKQNFFFFLFKELKVQGIT